MAVARVKVRARARAVAVAVVLAVKLGRARVRAREVKCTTYVGNYTWTWGQLLSPKLEDNSLAEFWGHNTSSYSG
jgi:hypothetical protein